MPQLATAPRPALRFFTPAKAALFRVPYFPQGIPAGFPSPADDHLQKALDLHEHLIKHPAATFLARVDGESMIDANWEDLKEIASALSEFKVPGGRMNEQQMKIVEQ